MLDHLAIHINYVERAIGCIGELDGAKPGIVGGDKLNLLLISRALRLQSHAIRDEKLAMHQVAAGIANKSIVEKFPGESVATINHAAGRAGKITGCAPAAFDRP